ncbi:MAG: hypothetical protein DRJ62_01985 [Thermoprotei archaeon]|nr:MAG: hypothetical protein DRJ62_01985 [Thermoprotei archaeon]
MAGQEYKPFVFPLIHPLPGRCLAECLFLVNDVNAFWRGITVKPLSCTITPHGDQEGLYAIQMFILCEDLEKIMDEARSLACVLKAEAKSSPHMKVGWGVDLFFFPLTIGRDGMRLFGLVGPFFIEGVEELKGMLGTATEAFLYHLGFSYGVKLAEGMMKMLGLKEGVVDRETVMTLARFFSDYARVVGCAVIEPYDLDVNSMSFTFKMKDCWEAVTHLKLYGRAESPVCYFTKGNIAGVASRVCGLKFRAVEEKCQATGDPYCLVRLELK